LELQTHFMRSLITFISVLIFSSSFAQKTDEQQIRQLLNSQVAEWNKGNIEKYMHGYWENDSLIFIGKSGPRYGYKNTLENYKKGYPDTAHMGKLSFEILQIKKLSADHAFVVGKWNFCGLLVMLMALSVCFSKR
jgi:ketosteroid isomerase-like protein